MTPTTISATADSSSFNNINTTRSSPNNAFHETQFQQQHSPFSQDENNFPMQESAWPDAFRETASSSTRHNSTRDNKEPLTSNQQKVFPPPSSASNQQQTISSDAWKVGSKLFESSQTTTMREPVAVSNTVDYNGSRHALRVVDGQSSAFESPRSTRQEFLEESDSAMAERHSMQDPRPRHPSPRQLSISANRAQSPNTRRTQSPSTRRYPSPGPIPRNPASGSPLLRSKQHQTSRDSQSVQSQSSKVTSGSVPIASDFAWEQNNDPDDQEQALFEQRLCDDIYGVAVRKINQNGKSNLRYVKCSMIDAAEMETDSSGFSSSRSVSSRSRGFARFRDRSVDSRSESRGFPRFRERSLDRSENNDVHRTLMKGKKVKVLAWGKKKDVKIPLERFVAVRKGKTTDRTRRNVCPASRILSLITDDPHNPSLDIEAPTRLDRDKFARAFSRFLSVPLDGDDVKSVMSNQSKDLKAVPQPHSVSGMKQQSVASIPDANSLPKGTTSQATSGSRGSRKKVPAPADTTGAPKQSGLPPIVSKSRSARSTSDPFDAPINSVPSSTNVSAADAPFSNAPFSKNSTVPGQSTTGTSERSQVATPGVQVHHNDDGSVVSSITGGGFDQEIVEELHVALTELKSELEESRAEAARAVKVAEQAIQSAENNSSKDWNSTVTHKAAEAAAQAQKKSAEAMAKARMAEERLLGERKAALIWKKQAESAEEEAGHWQTRAAAAEVQRAAMVEALENERKKAAALRTTTHNIPTSEDGKRDALESTIERNRALEFELEVMRQSLNKKMNEVASLQDCLAEIETAPEALKATKKNNVNDGARKALLSSDAMPFNADFDNIAPFDQSGDKEFGIVKTSNQLGSLPASAKLWAEQASQALLDSQAEVDRLRMRVASEASARRRLLHEVQDLRGTIRVYIRPRPSSKASSIISTPSQEVLLLHRERSTFRQDAALTPMSFDFDGILSADMEQQDVYDELEDVCLSAMDGYKVCVMTYGQTGTGKTTTLLGNVKYEGEEQFVSIKNFGVHLRAVKQMFSVLKHRRERYQDVVSISVVEVCDERLCDLLVGTHIGEASGRPEISRKSNRKRNDSTDGTSSQNSKPTRLEIKTNHNGETIVHGLLAVEVSCFEDVYRVWTECLSKRALKVGEQGIDMSEHESKSHLIGTIRVHSTNISTGVKTQGKIQFVDLASSNVLPRRQSSASKKSLSTPESILSGVGNNQEWKFANRSMATLNEVIQARSQYQRSVPYRNSTITHLLRDSLESDTKVVVLGCISSDLKDLQETACTLKFAQKLRNVVIGKATRHTV